MELKTAVVMCGMVRELSLAAPSWSFVQQDLHLVTWDVTTPNRHVPKWEPVGEIPRREMFRSICVVPYGMLPDNLDVAHRSTYLRERAARRLAAYERIHGFRYDRVLLTRPDLFTNFDIDLEVSLEPGDVLVPNPLTSDPPSAEDILFYMDRETFDVMATMFEKVRHKTLYDIHRGTYEFMISEGLRPRAVYPTDWTIPRSVSRRHPVMGSRDEIFAVYARDASEWYRRPRETELKAFLRRPR